MFTTVTHTLAAQCILLYRYSTLRENWLCRQIGMSYDCDTLSMQAQGVEVTSKLVSNINLVQEAQKVSKTAADEQPVSKLETPDAEPLFENNTAGLLSETLSASAKSAEHIFCAEDPNVFVYCLSSKVDSIQQAMTALNKQVWQLSSHLKLL